MNRLAGAFDVYSLPGRGTALFARVRAGQDTPPAPPLEIGGLYVSRPGETECGDLWRFKAVAGGGLILLSDGLGHGPEAARASRKALELFEATTLVSPAEVVRVIHEGLKPTRGAAVAVTLIEPAAGRLTHSGLGNVSGVILAGAERRHLVSHNGIAGHAASRIAEFSYEWTSESVLVLTSDGLSGHWDLANYPGLAWHHPGLIAAMLYRDFCRGWDDASVVAVREQRS